MADELIEKLKKIEPELTLSQIEVAIQVIREHDATLPPDSLVSIYVKNERNRVKQECKAAVEPVITQIIADLEKSAKILDHHNMNPTTAEFRETAVELRGVLKDIDAIS